MFAIQIEKTHTKIVDDGQFKPDVCKETTQARGRVSETVHWVVGFDPIGDNALQGGQAEDRYRNASKSSSAGE
jgi:hypothetical protein